jgi:diadenosine tetraphosphate (Ap4A) HIT family hydrolase
LQGSSLNCFHFTGIATSLPEKGYGPSMAATAYSEFAIDERLRSDSAHVLQLGLCELRLMNDSRWPWLILIPQRPRVTEVHDLQPLDQAMLTFETNLVAASLKSFTSCDKINSASIGNIVNQLHVHVIARNAGDPNWPGPVWGYGQAVRYDPADLETLVQRLRNAF